MVLEKQIYELESRPQLIDLNKNYKKFRLQFQVVSMEANQEFQALVMNQEQVENTPDLNKIEMKIAQGKIGGNIVADNEKYQNYYLVMRNSVKMPETMVKVEVTKNIEEILEGSPEPEDPPSPLTKETTETDDNEEYTKEQEQIKVPFYRKPWFWAFIAVFVFLVFLYYYYVIRGRGIMIGKEDDLVMDTTTTEVVSQVPEPSNPGVCRTEEMDKKEKLYQRLAGIQ